MKNDLVKETGLLVFNAQFAVNGGKDSLYLSHGEHAAQKGIAGVVAVAALVHDTTGLVGKCHAVVHTHRQLWVLLLEDAAQLNQIGTAAQVAGLGEVAIGEDVTRTQVNEVGARGKLLSQLHHIVIGTCRQ